MKWANSNPAASIGLAGRVAENATAARSELLSKPHLRGGGPGKNRALPIDLLTLDFSGGEALHSRPSKHRNGVSMFRCGCFDPLLEVQVDFFTVLSVETCRIYSLPSIEVLVAVELAGGAPQRAGRNAGPIAADVIHPGLIETHVSIAVGSHVIRERCRAFAEEADLVRTGLVEIIEQPEVGSDTVGIGR